MYSFSFALLLLLLLLFISHFCHSFLLYFISENALQFCRNALNGTNLMLLCGKLDERVIPLMQIIIYWAKHSKLVGGHAKFKTYAVFLMVVYFLQTRIPPVLPSVERMFEKTGEENL